MTTFDEFNQGGLDVEAPEQDKIISQLIFDKDFLNKSIRAGITSELFVSDIRQKVVEYIYAYLNLYKEPPLENITDILAQNKTRITIREDDLEMAIEFISRVIQIKNSTGTVKRLMDKLLEFKRKQIIANTVSKMSKVKDQIDGTPDRLEKIMLESMDQLKRSESMTKPESLFQSDGYDSGLVLSKFGIDEIDSAIGGGLFAPNLVIIQAFTGRGKTWSIAHLIKMASRLGNDSVAFITEMANRKFRQRMRMTLTGMTAKDIYNNMNEVDNRMRLSMTRNCNVAIAPEEWKTGDNVTVDSIKPFVEEIEEQRGRPQKLIFIDSPDDLEPPIGTIASKDQDKSKAIFTWLRNYAQNYDKCIVVTGQSQRSAEKLLWTTSGNIGDDINKVRRATLGISINGYKTEVDANFTRLLVFKNTHGPDMRACWIWSDHEKGQWTQESGPIKNLDIGDYKNRLSQRGVKLTNETGIG